MCSFVQRVHPVGAGWTRGLRLVRTQAIHGDAKKENPEEMLIVGRIRTNHQHEHTLQHTGK